MDLVLALAGFAALVAAWVRAGEGAPTGKTALSERR